MAPRTDPPATPLPPCDSLTPAGRDRRAAWTAAETSGLAGAYERGADLRCPGDGTDLTALVRHARGGNVWVAVLCPRCGRTAMLEGRA